MDQQHDADDALVRERGRSDRMRMPHERDESATAATAGGRAPAQEQAIGQAAADLARGLQDTDCRSQPATADSACPRGAGALRGRLRGRNASVAAPARLGRAARRMRRPGA